MGENGNGGYAKNSRGCSHFRLTHEDRFVEVTQTGESQELQKVNKNTQS